jgi:hypothetical protein
MSTSHADPRQVPPVSRPERRRHRHRPGIIRVILVDVSRRQQPYPGGQLRRHIRHPLTRGEQLLSQQMPQPARAFDRPGALRPGLRPPQQPLRLGGQLDG